MSLRRAFAGTRVWMGGAAVVVALVVAGGADAANVRGSARTSVNRSGSGNPNANVNRIVVDSPR